ncbi:ComEC family competence protein [Pontibacter sp. BT310]|uniref:ComEC family competence protein n=1 Tax=Pontibacter populi TaxID=890055 RepID=A0ABS6X6C2_9BACT|nr:MULTISPECIES: ComEC/Rec2 family competence protein [Pontibacter]MBJ6116687.1 ComEC family competence protein [Pontibacter sp. BT310]MBR0569111.1 ComEC family competence protein [Microvirga sp. STS03]MBW3363541.1 ComEC family competence protein [Pontibacter populi]
MLQWAPYPFLRIALSFIAGILAYTTIGEGFRFAPEVFTFFVALFLGLFIYSRSYRSAEVNTWVGIVGLFCFASAGFWITELRTPHLQPNHLSNLNQKPTYYTGIVNDYVIQKPGYQRTVLAVDKVLVNGSWQKATGQVQVTVPHDTPEEYTFTYGDKLLIKGSPLPVQGPLNPEQFNYKAYLQKKSIYHRQNLQAQQFAKLGNDPPNFLLYLSIKIRRYLEETIKENVQAKREAGISTALILGVKDDLDNDVRDSYAATGTMHVLAVSGMHVGLIFGVFLLLFKSVNLNKSQRLVFVTIVLTLLWLYAFVTGLSASVLRAVLMFSLVMIAMVWSRRHNIYNTLAIVAFLLLFYDPYFLFDVGFQLSFLAVLGIVTIHPAIYSLLDINNRFLDKIWELFSIAVAAQLITLPLGIYYFHQFPVYFWLANIVVVPVSSFGLYAGLLALVFYWVPYVSELLFAVHFGFIWVMNEINLLLSTFPNALINGLDITALQSWLLYSLLAFFTLFLVRKKLKYLVFATCIVGVLSVQQILETIAQQNQKLLTIYSLRGSTAMAFIQSQEAILVTDSLLAADKQNYNFNIQAHLWDLGVAAPTVKLVGEATVQTVGVVSEVLLDGNELLVWESKKILLIRRPLKVQPISTMVLDYIILAQNVRIRPEELQAFAFKTIVLDGSNKPWYIERMRAELSNKKIPVYDVTTSGALVQQL